MPRSVERVPFASTPSTRVLIIRTRRSQFKSAARRKYAWTPHTRPQDPATPGCSNGRRRQPAPCRCGCAGRGEERLGSRPGRGAAAARPALSATALHDRRGGATAPTQAVRAVLRCAPAPLGACAERAQRLACLCCQQSGPLRHVAMTTGPALTNISAGHHHRTNSTGQRRRPWRSSRGPNPRRGLFVKRPLRHSCTELLPSQPASRCTLGCAGQLGTIDHRGPF